MSEQHDTDTNDTEEQKVPTINSNRDLLLYMYLQIKMNRKWWLLPLLAVLGFLGLFVSLTGNASILPAIYALF
ncbi:MAG: DUF5989 family protein [bacterium]